MMILVIAEVICVFSCFLLDSFEFCLTKHGATFSSLNISTLLELCSAMVDEKLNERENRYQTLFI